MQKLLSVVVPVYKVEKYLKRCLDSILAQTYKNFELILIDDGSPDGSPAICDEYAQKDERIKVIHKVNGGVSTARNEGIIAARSEYITFIDSDDWIEPDYFATLMANADDADYVCSGINWWVGKDKIRSKLYNIISGNKVNKLNGIVIHKDNEFCGEIVKNSKKYFRLFDKGIITVPYAKIFKKSLIKDLFLVGQKKGQDAIFNIQYILNCKTIKNIDYVGYNYEFRNQESVTHKVKYNNKPSGEYYPSLENLFGNNMYLNSLIVRFCFRHMFAKLKYEKQPKKEIIKQLKELYKNYPKDKLKFSKSILLKDKIVLFIIKHKLFRLYYFGFNKIL